MSIKYYTDINFRNKICAKMLYLNKQLKLKLKLKLNNTYNITDVSVLGNVQRAGRVQELSKKSIDFLKVVH